MPIGEGHGISREASAGLDRAMGRRGVSRPPSQHRTPRAPWSSPNGSAQTPPNRNPAAPTHATRSPSPSAPRPGNPAEWTTSSAAQTTPSTPASPRGETTFNSPPRTLPTRLSAPNTRGRGEQNQARTNHSGSDRPKANRRAALGQTGIKQTPLSGRGCLSENTWVSACSSSPCSLRTTIPCPVQETTVACPHKAGPRVQNERS